MALPLDTDLAPARQERSRRTAERILAAALALLSEKPFEELSVAEIARRAGVSVGGFYARFPGKGALFHYLNVHVIEEVLARAREELAPEAVAGLGARGVIGRYVELAVREFRRHRTVLQQVALHTRSSADSDFRTRVQEANTELHDLFRARLAERADEFRHPDPKRAVDVALTAVSGAMREYVLFGERRAEFAPLADERLAAELTQLFCAYLGIDA